LLLLPIKSNIHLYRQNWSVIARHSFKPFLFPSIGYLPAGIRKHLRKEQIVSIEIITTPNEGLKETGFGGVNACNSIKRVIQELGYTVNLNICETKSDLDRVVQRQPDLVILGVKYLQDKAQKQLLLADYFEKRGIPFTGSTPKALNFDSNKISAKIFLRNQGVQTAEFFTAIPDQYAHENELPLPMPLFLKPLSAANGNGVDEDSFVNDFDGFTRKVASLFSKFNHSIMAEAFLGGREFTVSVIENGSGELLTAPIEIVPPILPNGLRILGEEVKKADSETLKRVNDMELKASLSNLAIDVFAKLEARDFGRVDIKSTADGHLHFLEINLVPGLTEGTSYFPRAFEIEHEYKYPHVVKMVLENALSRCNIPPNKSVYHMNII